MKMPNLSKVPDLPPHAAPFPLHMLGNITRNTRVVLCTHAPCPSTTIHPLL